MTAITLNVIVQGVLTGLVYGLMALGLSVIFGVMRVTNAVLPLMRARKAGTVINMSSSGGVAALPFAALYCATKFALEGYTEALRHGPLGVLHRVLDRVVDGYIEIDGEVETDLDEIETAVFSDQRTDTGSIYRLKREVLEFRRAVMPLVEPLKMLHTSPRVLNRRQNSENTIVGRFADAAMANASATRNAMF